MEHKELLSFLQSVGKDPTRLIFEDELTGISNRRFLGNFFTYKVDWESLAQNPVSLIMVDLDHFKNINDSHGHDVGDQALIHVANILKEVAGDTGLPIRYAGDEFMILLPGAAKPLAMSMAGKLVDTVRSRPCHPEDTDLSISMTFSVGVSSAPDDAASSKELVQKADNALYHSKKNGRDQMTDAAALAPAPKLTPTALAEKTRNTISGRKEQLAQLVAYLKSFMQRESQLVLIEGAPGMGKTTFLSTIEKTLSRTKLQRIRIAGRPEELFRPYYLAASVMLALMDQQSDKGASLIAGISAEERESLSLVLPQLRDNQPIKAEDGAKARERIFATLVSIIPSLTGSAPLVLLVDDLHMADEASLLVLRAIVRKNEMPMFICGTTAAARGMAESELSPLDRFREKYADELLIRVVHLSPLSPADVGTHVAQLFPGIALPEGTLQELSSVSQGNPLFLNEILQKLARDGMIHATAGKYSLENLPEDYLPHSIEEIVSQKMTTLGEEGKRILDTVSAYGENVSLGTLTGTTQEMEARLLDFLDQAVNEGLVTLDFDVNDENIRFIGSRVRDIVYAGVRDPGRESIHERIGAYQESLLEKGYLPSASILAYHFQRSANLEKAKIYEQLLAVHNNEIFDAKEAASYTGEWPEDLDVAAPLDQESLALVPEFLRNLLVALRNTKLYPGGSQLTANAVAKLNSNIQAIHAGNERLVVGLEKKKLFANGDEVDTSEFKSSAETFLSFMEKLELCGITFEKGVSDEELTRMLSAIATVERKMIREGFWKSFGAQHELSRIRFRQVRYKEVAKSAHVAGNDAIPQRDMVAGVDDRELDPDEIFLATDTIKAFLGAASKMKLYPPDGPVAAIAIGNVLSSLGQFLGRRSRFTIAVAGNAFLINGSRAESQELSKFTGPCMRYLKSLGLNSLTFLKNASAGDFVAFFAAALSPPKEGATAAFWQSLGHEKGIAGILFDQTVYGVMDAQKAKGIAVEPLLPEEQEGEAGQPLEMAGGPAQVPFEAQAPAPELSPEAQIRSLSPSEISKKVRELVLGGDRDGAETFLAELVGRYSEGSDIAKQDVLDQLAS
ncbi:MAG: diguanylate cyclase, partial [Thermodesulfobacteriota bacterium]